MIKRLFLLSLLVYLLGIVFLLAGPSKIKPQPQQVYDIAIVDMWLDESCQLCAKFENKGNTTIKGEIKGDVWFDVNNVKYFILKNFSLPPGQTYIWKGESPFTFIGSHNVRITIKPQNNIVESDKKNNTMSKSFECKIKVIPGVVKGLPDLVVKMIVFEKVKDTVYAGNKPCEIFNVLITIGNEGKGDAGPFKVLLEKKYEPYYPEFTKACELCEIDVPGLAAGKILGFSPFQFNTCGEGVKYLFRVTVDSKNSVKESDETNNSKVEAYPKPIKLIPKPIQK